MADRSYVARHFLGIDRAFRLYHDHRLDPVDKGRYFRRLPDGTSVPIEDYEERLKAYRAAQDEDRGAAEDDGA